MSSTPGVGSLKYAVYTIRVTRETTQKKKRVVFENGCKS